VNWIKAAGGLATAFDVTTKGILHAVFEVRHHCSDSKPWLRTASCVCWKMHFVQVLLSHLTA